jgi:hypothetical protein
MGRLDRYGVGQPVRSFSLADPKMNCFLAWSECLDLGFGVFEQSIASLQYLVDEEMKTIRRDLLVEASMRLPQAKSTRRRRAVRQELQRIQILDELDAIGSRRGTGQGIAERLKLEELHKKRIGERPSTAGSSSSFAWRLGRVGSKGPIRRYWFQRPKQGHQTLMPVSRLERNFMGVIDRLAPDWMRPSIYPITFDRQTANGGVRVDVFPEKGRSRRSACRSRLGWIGDAFIDAMADYAQDDAAYASRSGSFDRKGTPRTRPISVSASIFLWKPTSSRPIRSSRRSRT